jgi:hypothetical protein
MSRDSAAPAAGATAPTENDKSNGGIFTLFNEEGDSYSDDYEYMEQDDPDKKAIELDTPTSRIPRQEGNRARHAHQPHTPRHPVHHEGPRHPVQDSDCSRLLVCIRRWHDQAEQ